MEKEISQKFEIYKLFVESAITVSAWRQSTNKFFILVNSAVLGLKSFLDCGFAILIGGIIINVLWYKLIVSYKKLNEAKFSVINKMECEFSFSPFKDEWEFVKENKKADFTSIEKYIPCVFIMLYLVMFLWTFFVANRMFCFLCLLPFVLR